MISGDYKGHILNLMTSMRAYTAMYKVKYKTKVTEHEEDQQEEFSG
jgi:hypothetical protein